MVRVIAAEQEDPSSIPALSKCLFTPRLYGKTKKTWQSIIVQCQRNQIEIKLFLAMLPGAIMGYNKHSLGPNEFHLSFLQPVII